MGRQLGSGMREFKESITGKDRDDDDDEKDEAEARARHELDPAPASEPEVVTGQARTRGSRRHALRLLSDPVP